MICSIYLIFDIVGGLQAWIFVLEPTPFSHLSHGHSHSLVKRQTRFHISAMLRPLAVIPHLLILRKSNVKNWEVLNIDLSRHWLGFLSHITSVGQYSES